MEYKMIGVTPDTHKMIAKIKKHLNDKKTRNYSLSLVVRLGALELLKRENIKV